MNLKFPLSFLLIFSTFFLSASVPDIINYTTKDYNAHSINYDCIQDTSGVIYIANAYCVLEYDGQTFRKIPLVAGKSAVSLAKDSHGKIYIGSSSDFGCLTKDSQEKTVYSSLKHLMPTKKKSMKFLKPFGMITPFISPAILAYFDIKTIPLNPLKDLQIPH